MSIGWIIVLVGAAFLLGAGFVFLLLLKAVPPPPNR